MTDSIFSCSFYTHGAVLDKQNPGRNIEIARSFTLKKTSFKIAERVSISRHINELGTYKELFLTLHTQTVISITKKLIFI
jgi:hypothetical protein